MYGNGYMIGMTVIITATARQTTLKVHPVAPTASAEVAAGAALPSACARRIAASTAQTTAAAIWASAWPEPLNF